MMPVAFQAAVELPRESYEYETAEICLTMILLLSGETEEAKKSGAKPAKDRTLALVFPVPVRLPTLSAPTSRCQVSLEASRKETSQWIQTSPLVIINWTPPGQEPRQNHSKYGDLRVFETQSLPPGCDRLQSVTLRRNSSPGGLPPRGGAIQKRTKISMAHSASICVLQLKRQEASRTGIRGKLKWYGGLLRNRGGNGGAISLNGGPCNGRVGGSGRPSSGGERGSHVLRTRRFCRSMFVSNFCNKQVTRIQKVCTPKLRDMRIPTWSK
ncbi:uncharacterized protein CIMG_11474 [Coccidioides immitis RS]|uniref:Uncharacterized protein n=1 Tax=Coccidioides immitis (strain RS) TaxID=246410 RepID=A0A0D8JVG1_COCIM|nr:uncharacterized protein CIMG_11474 [Coccidioides immitis RS]KJF61099.1 hypothetical protein CIMG_11474 [Coccidioides immitis RS]